jgi:hypothetical protein
MRRALTLACAILSAAAVSAQDSGTNDYQSIIEESILTGALDGHVEKHLRTIGDEGSIEIARAISDKDLSAPLMLLVLTLIQDCFSDVSQIPVKSNRNPRVALLLLRTYNSLASPTKKSRRCVDTKAIGGKKLVRCSQMIRRSGLQDECRISVFFARTMSV